MEPQYLKLLVLELVLVLVLPQLTLQDGMEVFQLLLVVVAVVVVVVVKTDMMALVAEQLMVQVKVQALEHLEDIMEVPVVVAVVVMVSLKVVVKELVLFQVLVADQVVVLPKVKLHTEVIGGTERIKYASNSIK